MNKMDNYNEYLDKWLSGLRSEITFWDKLIKTKGESIKAEKVFQLRSSFDAPFILDGEIEESHIKFNDIGSRPFSNCGIKSNKFTLEFTAVDPLAGVYKSIKEKYSVTIPVNPVTGMCEIVDIMFGENSFDLSHMSNSLDHSFDPVIGIHNMIYITKIGGKIVFRHNENEAEHAHYSGVHQWNIHCEDGKMIIWKPGTEIDIGEVFGEYITTEKADIRITCELVSNWNHNYFVFKKVKEIPRASNNNVAPLLNKLMEHLCLLKYND